MKKIVFLSAVLLTAAMQLSAQTGDKVITKENGTTIVNTTTLCKDVEGYNGPTPVKIYIKKNKVEKVEALPSQEGRKYMAMVKKSLLDKWNGLSVKKAQQLKVDAVTGATFSSEAIIKNVQTGLSHYQKHK